MNNARPNINKPSAKPSKNLPTKESVIERNWTFLQNALILLLQKIVRGLRDYWQRIKTWRGGGLPLALLPLLIIFSGCSPQVVRVPCSPESGLLKPIRLAEREPNLTNGQIAEQYRSLRDSVSLDNEAKKRLESELDKCRWSK